jgi:hypothetical protein
MTSDNETIIRSIRTLYDLSKAINSTLDITRVEELLLQQTSQLMESAKEVVLLLDKGKQSLTHPQ